MKKWVYVVLGVLFIVFGVFAIKALFTPKQINKTYTENKIQQKTSYSFKAEIIPCTLYPQGGIISPEGPMFTKITNTIIVDVVSLVISDKPVKLTGSYKTVVELAAEDLWKKEYLLDQKNHIELEGKEIEYFKKSYSVDLTKINDFIFKVEEEINIRPNKYTIRIKPYFIGSIVYQDEVIDIDSSPEFNFDYSNGKIQLSEETPQNNTFIKEDIVEKHKTIYQSLNILGVGLPLIFSRYLFTILCILILSFYVYTAIKAIKSKRRMLTEAQKIDKKYHNRMIHVYTGFDLSNKNVITLTCFKSLVQLSDDKDLPILRYGGKEDKTVMYYIIDGDCVFVFHANDDFKELPYFKYNQENTGSDFYYGQ